MEVGRMTLPAQVAGAIEKLERAGYEAAAVGGCVRDHLMERAPLDYDLATSARCPIRLSACSPASASCPPALPTAR